MPLPKRVPMVSSSAFLTWANSVLPMILCPENAAVFLAIFQRITGEIFKQQFKSAV